MQILSELVVYYFSITQEETKKEMCTKELYVYGSSINVHAFVVQAILQANQANPEVTFNGQWLAEKVSDNIDSLIESKLI